MSRDHIEQQALTWRTKARQVAHAAKTLRRDHRIIVLPTNIGPSLLEYLKENVVEVDPATAAEISDKLHAFANRLVVNAQKAERVAGGGA